MTSASSAQTHESDNGFVATAAHADATLDRIHQRHKIVLGALLVSPLWPVRVVTRAYMQVFRNAPLLVLIYFSTYVFPFEIDIGHVSLPFPDWIKVTLGLALPNTAAARRESAPLTASNLR
ncbi:hypothetical protein B0G83_11240 [Paraburkholderia sp. BL21I4N1]|nr:hypothetical protein B0G83_11240 [Paraburkholderia sp. BL21I4N1]